MGLFDLFKKGAGDLDLTGDGLTITAKEKKALIQLLENKARESGNTNLLNVSFAIKNALPRRAGVMPHLPLRPVPDGQFLLRRGYAARDRTSHQTHRGIPGRS